MTLKSITPLSGNKHLKLYFERNSVPVTALLYSTSTEQFPYEKGDVLDLAVALSINEYNGNVSLSVVIKNFKASDEDNEKSLESNRCFEEFCKGAKLSSDEILSLTPDRNDFALLYRYLRQNGGYSFSVQTLVHKLDNKLSFGKIRVILKAMSQLNLIEMEEGLKTGRITLKSVSGKVDLESAEIIRKLKGE
jgi:single-stranded-DNA-specific exonuclease